MFHARALTTIALATALLALAACDAKKPTAPQPDESQQAEATQPATADEEDMSPDDRAEAPGASGVDAAALASLDEMDPRAPVPLQPMMAWHQKQNMQQHLVAIQNITGAVAKDDWAGATEAAKTIATSPQMQQMCQHMGAGAEGFTERALEFHRRADAIVAATEEKDLKATLQATSHTLEACTSCHAMFKQQVVTAARWTELTGSEHTPKPGMHGGHHGGGHH